MNLDKLIAISGRSGLFRMVSNQSNGLIVEDLETKKRGFVSGRLHQFTPLESISIYVQADEQTVELKKVFELMAANLETYPLAQPNDAPAAIRAYFTNVLPQHDQDKVLISDIKKMLKWFGFLQKMNLLGE
jgi:hypothetical protein